MKLRQHKHKSPVGIKFKFSDKHSLPFHKGTFPPPHPGFQMSNGKSRRERVKEWNQPTTKNWKIIYIFQVEKGIRYLAQNWTLYKMPHQFCIQFCLGMLNNVLYEILLKFSSFLRYIIIMQKKLVNVFAITSEVDCAFHFT